MINYEIVKIIKKEDYNKIMNFIPKKYWDDNVIEELTNYIGDKCDRIAVENPYSEKDYLSTYYIHYAKKYKDISKNCYRIHFFNKAQYFGFITLRPTCHRKIGRAYIHPTLLLDQKSYLMTAQYKVNILGSQVLIDSFPWMHQEPDVSSCAHVSLWSILRYFSNKNANYSDATMGDVVEQIQNNYDRKIPSKGLRVEQISNLLIRYGFSTLIRNPKRVSDEIYSYIESGLPLIGIVPTQNDDAHAICIIGHGKIDGNVKKISDDLYERIEFADSENNNVIIKTDIILSTKYINSIIVNDDNYFPFRTVYKEAACIVGKNKKYEPNYIVDSIQTFIIPLYEKMQITYNEVYNVVMNLLLSKTLKGLPSPKILRFFITSSNSYKRSVKNRDICPELKKLLLTLNMPKFVWCIEISSKANYINGLTDGLIIVDATDSSEEDCPFILFHDNKMVKYYNGSRYIIDHFFIKPYEIYINNLEEYDNV